ncbi:hypothetical protein BLNAU_12180 [Blattamonas nauphoetae]|uniref:SPRY domain-containing protein n=1 Tax=Blattamonas nauphoetae TaxID=2049346 RepID=A0ABQ9XMU8_9EUKA|nr:hypothetical protein BLNAU_12180 [Blattamonas nauphoetae]
MGHSCSSLRKPKTKSKPALAKPTLNENAPAQLLALPPLLFTSPSHFTIENTTITRSRENFDPQRFFNNSSILLKTPITQGIISVTITLLFLPNTVYGPGGINIGLLDSTAPVPKLGENLVWNVQNSVSLSSCYGSLCSNTPSTGHRPSITSCHLFLKEGDCVRIEVDMESTPRKVHFFVNGKSGNYFVSDLPPSVRIGFTVDGLGTSFRIDRIAELRNDFVLNRHQANIHRTFLVGLVLHFYDKAKTARGIVVDA